jgi:hypothetical protein
MAAAVLDPIIDFATATVQAGSTIPGSTGTGVTIVLPLGYGDAWFPAGTFNVVGYPDGSRPGPVSASALSAEVVTVTRSLGSDTLNVTARGQSNSHALSTWALGWRVEQNILQSWFNALITTSPGSSTRNVIAPTGSYDALRALSSKAWGFALGSGAHGVMPQGSLTFRLDSESNLHWNYNPLKAPDPLGNFGRTVADMLSAQHGRVSTSAGYIGHCMGDPSDIDLGRVGPEGGFPWGYGGRGPMGTFQDIAGQGTGSHSAQYSMHSMCVPFNGNQFSRGATYQDRSTYIEMATDGTHRKMTPDATDSNVAGSFRFYNVPKGSGRSLDYWGQMNSGGRWFFGRSAVDGAGSGTQFTSPEVTIRGDSGRNEVQRIVQTGNTFATGTLRATANPSPGDQVIVNGMAFTYQYNPARVNDIAIGATAAESLQNLANAMNGSDLAGESYWKRNRTGTLNGAMDGSQLTMTINTNGGAGLPTPYTGVAVDVPVYFLIDSEIVRASAVDESRLVFTITRGAKGTTPATHSNGATVTMLCGSYWSQRWSSTLHTAVNNSTTTFVVDAVNENTYPQQSANLIVAIENELVEVTNISDDGLTWTVNRGYGGTTAAAHAASVAITTDTKPPPDIACSTDVIGGNSLVFSARSRSLAGNSYTTTTTGTALAFDAATLSGANVASAGAWQYLHWGPPADSPSFAGVGTIMEGTVAVTSNSAVVTGTGTHWSSSSDITKKLQPFEWIKVGNGSDYKVYQIKSVDSDTQITLGTPGGASTVYTGQTGTGLTLRRVGELSGSMAWNASNATVQTTLETTIPSIAAAMVTLTSMTRDNAGSGGVGRVTNGTNFRETVFEGGYIRVVGDPADTFYQVTAVDSDSVLRIGVPWPATTTVDIQVLPVAITGGPLPDALFLNFCGALRNQHLLNAAVVATGMGAVAYTTAASVPGLPSGRSSVDLLVQAGGPHGSRKATDIIQVVDTTGEYLWSIDKYGALGTFVAGAQGPYTSTTTLGRRSQPDVYVDTTSAAVTINLPQATATPPPTKGVRYRFYDVGHSFATHNLTIGRNGGTIDGAAADLVISSSDAVPEVMWDGTGWRSSTVSGSAVAGNGLGASGFGASQVLSVNVDGSTIEINSDTLRVKDAGITGAKIASSVALAGSPTTTTQAVDDSSTKLATTAFVLGQAASAAPAALGTAAAGTSNRYARGDHVHAKPTESELNLSDVTTLDSSTSKHGFLKKLNNSDASYMDGTGAWSTPTTFRDLELTGEGILAETASRFTCPSQTLLISQSAYGMRVALKKGQVVANILVGVQTLGGASLTVTRAALFDKTGANRLAMSNDVSASFVSGSAAAPKIVTCPMAASYTVLTSDVYYIVFYCNGTTPPTLFRHSNSTFLGLAAGSGVRPAVTQASAGTDLGSTFTLADTTSPAPIPIWAAIT